MGSRLRQDVKHFFECFCEVVGPKDKDTPAWIIQKFPESYKDEGVLKSVPKFAFPCEFDKSVAQLYSFVLTNVDSKWTFGFCRHDSKSETSLVILTYLPWHEAFSRFLNYISELTHGVYSDQLWKFLDSVYQNPVPRPGCNFVVDIHPGIKPFTYEAPSQFKLPSIPENRNLTEYYNAVDNQNMMIIFASMLFERRIIFTSKKLSRLTACVQSANSLLYPMSWQHIFIPVLPQALIDYLLAPMPYLIGLPHSLLGNVRRNDLGDVVMIDADNNTIETPFHDLESLPTDVVSNLQKHLRNRASLLGDGVSRAFLRTIVQLIGGYRDALKISQGKKITFCDKSFVESRPLSMQPFLTKMLELQIFQQFIEERLELLNAGLGFSDEFELEVCNYLDKSNSKIQQYKEWVHTMKKEGSAFFKTVKNRANPAVRSAVKTVKDKGRDVKSAYRGIRSKLKDRKDGMKPSSAPNSPTTSRSKFSALDITNPAASGSCNVDRSGTPQFHILNTPQSISPQPVEEFAPMNFDLMGDLQDVIFRNYYIVPSPSDNSNSKRANSSMVTDRNVRELNNIPSTSKGSSNYSNKLSSSLLRDDAVDSVFKYSHNRTLSPTKSEPIIAQGSEPRDLIRLDSTPSITDFDPLFSSNNSPRTPCNDLPLIGGLTNPLYPYYNHHQSAGSSKQRDTTADNLLSEYGIDFNKLKLRSSMSDNGEPSSNLKQKPQYQWTTFD